MKKLTKLLPALLCAALLFSLMPVCASAATVPDNPSGTTVADVAFGDTMTTNNGTVTTNNGTVATNNGTVDDNGGTVTTNTGTVTTNTGTVYINYGWVAANYGGVATNNGTVYTNNGGVDTNTGTVATNEGTVYNVSDTAVVNANSGSRYKVYSLVTVTGGTAADAGSNTLVGIIGAQFILTASGDANAAVGEATFTALSSGGSPKGLTASRGVLSYDAATGIYTLTGVDGCVVLSFAAADVTGGFCATVISFAGGGGAGEMPSVSIMPGTDYTIPDCGFEAPGGQSFVGWSRTGGSAGGAIYQPGDVLNLGADECLTAVWG